MLRETLIGILLPLLGTVLGAACVFFMKNELGDTSKKAISGFAAGVIGIVCTILLCIPITYIVRTVTGIKILTAALPFVGGIILVLISMLLTFIAGLIPSGVAAKKDPVEALRTE